MHDFKEYNRELTEVLTTRDIDKLIEFADKWAFTMKSKKLQDLRNQPREFVERVMHNMICAKKSIPIEIRRKSERWLNNPFIKLAGKMKLVAKDNPITEDTYQMPHSRHWIDFSSGLKICFTLKTFFEDGPKWHLSASKVGRKIKQNEIDNLIAAFFDDSKPIESHSGLSDPNILHFWQKADT